MRDGELLQELPRLFGDARARAERRNLALEIRDARAAIGDARAKPCEGARGGGERVGAWG